MSKTIIFYAPFGKDTPPEKIGGAEAGCLKTLDCYRKGSFNVVQVHKPTMNSGLFRYLVDLLITPFIILWQLMKHRHSILHVAGFYLKLVYYEAFLIYIAKLVRHNTIYEIRNGGMIESFYEGSSLYKWALKKLISNSSQVLCQGLEYVDFIQKKWNRYTFYYPNYIREGYLSERPRARTDDLQLNLIYFGRIAESKNVDVIIEVFSHVSNKYPQAKLNLIGGYSNEYKCRLDAQLSAKNLRQDQVIFHGRQDFDYIHAELIKSHYFIFPSIETREGHSNSLTEAMGVGVVPIVSNAGFNASICGQDDLVIKTLQADLYAECLFSIEESLQWEIISDTVRKRVAENYTEKLISERLITEVNLLFENKH
ncbi:MAG TPA: glycosyltransferase [Sphingobacterium sp.]|nr:glycosyltransferase [Sphingobacterium sp.]